MEGFLLIQSVAVTVLATGLALLGALPVAVTLQWVPGAWRRGILGASLLVLALPGFFVAGMWMEWIGFAGAWRIGGGWLGPRSLPLLATGWVLGLLLWPVPALLLAGAWDRLDRRLLESMPELQGIALLRHGFWPLARASAASAALLVALLALGQFSVPALFQARVWPSEIWVEFSTRFDTRAALLKCWPLAGVALLLVILTLRRPLAWPVAACAPEPARVRERLGPAICTASAAGTVLLLLASAALPLGMALGQGRTWTELAPAAAAAGPAAMRSGLLAAGTATLVLAGGLATAPWRWPASASLAFALPGVFTGLGVATLFTAAPLAPLRTTPVIVLTAFAVRYGFVGWYLARRVWRSADPRLRDVARLEGAGLWTQWRHGAAPGSVRGLAGAWLVVYLLCLWDVETLILVVPPGGDTLSLAVFNLLHYGHNAQVTALCLILGALAVAPVLAWGLIETLRSRFGPGRPGLGAVALAAALGPGLGCRPPSEDQDPAAGSRVRTLDSRIFERVEVLGARGTGPGFFSKPRSVAVDGADDVYAVDMTGRVQKFDPHGRWLLSWQLPETDKGKAKGMALAADGSILVVEPHYHRVNRFDAGGHLLSQWGRHGTNAGELWFPRAIAAGPGGDLFVSEYGVVERVQRFRADGAEFVGSFGAAGTADGELNRAEGLGLDASGRVYVADSCNHRVQVFAPDGRWLRAHGRAGQGPGEFSYPYDVRVDAEGRQYVCEFGNSRVQVLDERDQVLEILGGPGSEPGMMNNPWSLCLDSHGNLYVADSLNHRLLRFVRRAPVAAVPAKDSGNGITAGEGRG